MALLAPLIPDENGIIDIYSQTTYGGGIIPRDPRLGGLAFTEIMNDPTPYNLSTYERAVILITGGFAD